MTSRINHLAVVVAAVVFFIWGALWYTVFGHQWMALMGTTAAASATAGPTTYILSFLIALVLAYVTAVALKDSSQSSAKHGASFGIFMGVGIYMMLLLNQSLFEMRPLGLWVLDGLYGVTGLAIIGAIVGGWRTRYPSTSSG
ncbi:MAG: DUF1761 domain-containing protein [Candidatus Eremiobacteraeota bacterium]|nr:DUF1761 domain-containing protein [Candidatus Eremiobacteraeota bacterium]